MNERTAQEIYKESAAEKSVSKRGKKKYKGKSLDSTNISTIFPSLCYELLIPTLLRFSRRRLGLGEC